MFGLLREVHQNSLSEICKKTVRREKDNRKAPVVARVLGFGLFIGGAFNAALAQTTFTDVANTLGLAGADSSHGLAFGDYDNDGDYDLYITNFDSPSILARNNGDGSFTDVTLATGAVGPDEATGVAWGDYNNDGWVDLYIASDRDGDRLYQNQGDGTFVDVTEAAGVSDARQTRGVSWADYNNDGYLDLFLANRYGRDRSDALFKNNGDGTFTDVAPELGLIDQVSTFGGIWFDYDNDRDQDLYLAIDFGDDRFYINNGDGTFTDATEAAGFGPPEHAMGVAIGDSDNDLDLDLFVDNNQDGTNAMHGPSLLFRNNSDGTFTEVTLEVGLEDRNTVDWGTNFIDYDNDGDLDLAVVAGALLSDGQANVLWQNDGFGQFSEVTDSTFTSHNGAAYGSAWSDYDQDGDLDWFIANELDQANVVFRNDGPVANWLAIKPQGMMSNRDGIGARIELTANGLTQVREISGGASYLSQDPAEAWFGLADASEVDSLIIYWPSGQIDQLTNVAINQRHFIQEGQTQVTGPERISLATADISIVGAVAGERSSGYNVALGSDLNNDGLADIIIGAPRNDADDKEDVGRVYFVFGREDFTGTIDLNDADVTLTGVDAGDVTGLYVFSKGDLNNDGIDDAVIGAPRGDGFEDGLFEGGDGYIVFGREVWPESISLATEADVTLYAAELDSRACGAINIGDFNNDGLSDLICGGRAAGPNGLDKAGEAYVVYGRNDWPSTILLEDADVTFQGITVTEQLGFSIGAGSDLNGDGFEDLAIGAWWYDAPGQATFDNSGAVYIFYGSDNPASLLTPEQADVSFFGLYSGAKLGMILDTSGDVNGDGIADILLGGHDVTSPSVHRGEAYLVYGRSDFEPVFDLNQADVLLYDTGTGDPGNDGTLHNDLNNDGLADIVLADATAVVDGVSGVGEVFVVFGSTALPAQIGLHQSADVIYQGIGSLDQAGTAIAMTGGDFNGDGSADFAVGALSADPETGLADAGASYIFLGQSNPDETEEVLTVTRANFVASSQFVEFKVESSLGGDVVITAEGFGPLLYRESSAVHSARFTGISENPGVVSLTSSGGASVEAIVADR